MDETELFVAGDIGGTNLNLAVAMERGGVSVIAHRARFRTQDEVGIAQPLRRFLAEADAAGVRGKVRSACIAGAGVVSEGRIAMSNVPWVVDGEEVRGALGCPVLLANDFRALLHGIATRYPADRDAFFPLAPCMGSPILSEGSPFAAIGAGTGLGMGFAIAGDPPIAYPSEGGNIRFPVWDEQSFSFMAWLRTRLGRDVCAEDWVSGIGIGLSFEYEAERIGRRGGEIGGILAAAPAGRAPMVAGRAATDALCSRVMERFADAYAICAADAVLTFLPQVLFLAGGIIAKNAALIAGAGRFSRRFLAHGKKECADALAATPVLAVLDYEIGLHGALELAMRQGARLGLRGSVAGPIMGR